jgi:hypothetical protein
MPKQVLHNLLAQHKDVSSQKTNDRLQFNSAGFNCDCNNIVATSPFTAFTERIVFQGKAFFPVHIPFPSSAILPKTLFSFGLRGPPVVA